MILHKPSNRYMFFAASLWISAMLPGLTAPVSAEQSSVLTPEQVAEDLDILRNEWATADRSLTKEKRRAFEAVVDRIAGGSNGTTTSDFYMEVARAVAKAENAHSRPRMPIDFMSLPIRTAWFGDGLYIVQTQPDFEHLLGAKIERFANLDTKGTLDALAVFVGGPASHVEAVSSELLTKPVALKAVGAISDANSPIELTVRLRSGGLQRVALPPIDAEAITQNRWTHVLTRADRRPVSARNPADVSSQWLEAKVPTLYVQLNTLSGDGPADGHGPQAQPLMQILEREVWAKRPKYVVVDLRNNGGGNFFNAQLFAQLLPHVIDPEGRVFVLVGRNTFSAAIVTAALLKGSGGERTSIVGQPMGDGPRFWAEARAVTLPHSKIVVLASLKEHDWANGCNDPENCFYGNIALGKANVSLDPEIAPEQTFADYLAGRDPTLDYVLEMAR